jgi:hypothetical protein
MTEGFSTARPEMGGYQTAFDNKGKYGSNNSRPYIHPDVPMYFPADGQNCIRIVDPIELATMGVYFFDVFFHRDVGYKSDYFLCDKEHNRGPCPSCEMVTPELWDSDKDMAKKLSSEMRRLIWVLDLQKPQEVGVLKLWSAPRTLSDEILTQSRRPDLNVFVDVAHPQDGIPVFFTRSGKGLYTKYTGVQLGQQAYPIGDDIAFQRFKFDDILQWAPYAEFAEALSLGQQAADQPGPTDPAGGYAADPANQPAANMGAAEAAAANPLPAKTPVAADPAAQAGKPGEIDYSDKALIDPNNVDCFRTNYDEYEECGGCPDNAKCQLPWPVYPELAQPTAKTAKPSKKTKPAPAGAGSGPARVVAPAANPAAPAMPQQAAGAASPQGGGSKITDAQQRLKDEIAKRKQQ